MFSALSRFICFSILFVFFSIQGVPVFSQNLTAASFTNKFQRYTQETLKEKIYLHTDKNFYVAGEIIWFKIYYVNGADYKPLQVSKVAYVEILNKDGRAELQSKISMEPGQSKGSFYLPVTLNSGNYTIRAYTNWMKNFDPAYFFEKRITIVNTMKNPEPATKNDSLGFSIDFFPEGGNLVSGFQSRVGFRATDREGKGINFTGLIVNDGGDTVTSFSPFKFGIGNFLFTPLPGRTYRTIIVTNDGKAVRGALPDPYSSGYVVNLSDNGEGYLGITIYRKKLAGEADNEQLLLAGHTRQVLHVAEVKMIGDNDSTVFLIDKMKIQPGVTHFTVFNGKGQPVCERIYFMKPSLKDSFNIKSDKESYSMREQVNLSVSEQNDPGKRTPFNLSAAVYNADNLGTTGQADIINYMWLTSDLVDEVESPGFYFTNDPNANRALDNLMLSQGWRKFDWDVVLNENNKSFVKYLPEYNGHLVTGRIRDTRKDKAVGDVIAFLSIPGRPFGFYASKSDADGWVHFEIKNYYGNGIIIAQPDMRADSFFKVEIIPPYAGPDTVGKKLSYALKPGTTDELLKRSINMQVQNVYSGDKLKSFENPVITDTLPFFGYPEIAYPLDDYKRFTTMEEVLREYVRQINVSVKKGKLSLKMFNPLAHDFYEDDVLTLLDGVPLANADKIFTYDPLKIKELDVIQSRYVLGPSVFNGVISFSTYEGMFDGFSLDPALVAIDYDGLQLQREFYAPNYSTKEQLEKRIPDFRTTLFWAPDIHTDKDGKANLQFYTSDRPGKYLVVVEGMDDHGEFIATQTTFNVK